MSKGYLQDIEIVDFYNRPIVTAYSDELGFIVPMKHIIEDHLGLDWKKMKAKMNATIEIPCSEDPSALQEVRLFNPVVISGYDISESVQVQVEHNYPDDDIPTFRPQSEYTCLPVEELNLFLAQISIRHVNLDVRETLYVYQKECGAALHDYWFRGMATNSRTNPSRISSARHEWCPRELSTKALQKGAARYASYAQRNFDSKVEPLGIEVFAKDAISVLLDLEADTWDAQEGTMVFLLAFMERAAFDILYFSIECNVAPEDLPEVLERNLLNAWENMGSLIISVQAPYNPFPGLGRGAPRELV